MNCNILNYVFTSFLLLPEDTDVRKNARKSLSLREKWLFACTHKYIAGCGLTINPRAYKRRTNDGH